MLVSFLTNKILSHITDVDFDRPSERCDICGHRTYMVKSSITEDVCPWCKIMRILQVLTLPADAIKSIISSIEEKHKIQL